MIIKTILILLFIHTYLNYRYKNNGILACGLFAFSGKEDLTEDQVRLVVQKWQMLGAFNDARGGDSCGVAIDNVLYKGINKESKFVDYITNNLLPLPKEHYTLIGHTRKSTRGANTEENAHPFYIDPLNTKLSPLILAHNGTLQNWTDIENKYCALVDTKSIQSDSIMLATAIANNPDKLVEILEYYEGAAALTFYYTDDPNTLYLFKGESYYSNDNLYAAANYNKGYERPLYYLETKEGIFVSSLSYALNFIIDDESQEVKEVKTNRIITIKNGKFTNTSIVVNRDEKGKLTSKTYPSYSGTANTQTPILLSDETALDTKYTNNSRVYFWRGHYRKNGHIIASNKEGLKKGLRLKLDKNGLSANCKGYDKTSVKEYLFWNGYIIKDENSLKTILNNTDKFYNKNSSQILPLELIHHVVGICGNPGYTGGDYRFLSTVKTVGYFSGVFTPEFNSPYQYKFETGSYKGRIINSSEDEDKLTVLLMTIVRKSLNPVSNGKIKYKSRMISTINPGYYFVTLEDTTCDKTYNITVNPVTEDILNSSIPVEYKRSFNTKPSESMKLTVGDAQKLLEYTYTDYDFEHYGESYSGEGKKYIFTGTQNINSKIDKKKQFYVNEATGEITSEKDEDDGISSQEAMVELENKYASEKPFDYIGEEKISNNTYYRFKSNSNTEYLVNKITKTCFIPNYKLPAVKSESNEEKGELPFSGSEWLTTDQIKEVCDVLIPTTSFKINYTKQYEDISTDNMICCIDVSYISQNKSASCKIFLDDSKGFRYISPKESFKVTDTMKNEIHNILFGVEEVSEIEAQFVSLVADLEDLKDTITETANSSSLTEVETEIDSRLSQMIFIAHEIKQELY